VEEARGLGVAGLGHRFCYACREGDDVVADLLLDFEDPVGVDVGVGGEQGGGVGGDVAPFGQDLRSGELDGEPGAVLAVVTPDFAHGGPGIAGDHRSSSYS